eukprot:1192493-Prorocentrum_minimum.AAC.2
MYTSVVRLRHVRPALVRPKVRRFWGWVINMVALPFVLAASFYIFRSQLILNARHLINITSSCHLSRSIRFSTPVRFGHILRKHEAEREALQSPTATA